MSPRRSLLLVPLAVGGLLACSGDDGSAPAATTTDTTVGSAVAGTATEMTAGSVASDPPSTTGGGDFCDRVQGVTDLPQPDLSQDWASVQQEIADGREEALASYDEAIEAAPEDLQEDLQTVRDFSDDVFEAIANSDSIEDLGTAIALQPQDVLDASSRIESYVQETCGFGLLDD